MEPLNQWICDTCGEVIERPEDGYVIWKEDEEGKLDDILIIHRNGLPNKSCDDKSYRLSLDLESFIGANGLVRLLSIVDPGPYHCNEYSNKVSNMRKFVDVIRRLHIPYYEEARLYWHEALADGFFNGANEVWMYLPRTLQELIERYRR